MAQCIFVAQENFSSPFRLFLLLKLLYPDGKGRLGDIEITAIAQLLHYASTKPVRSQVKRLIKTGWITYNTKTGYYQFHSFVRLRNKFNWESRVAIECRLCDLHQIDAIVGTAIYAYLHRAFWKRVGRDRVVRLKGRTFNSPAPHAFPPSEKFAPVATTGIKELYGISVSKASRMKLAAINYGWLKVQKSFKYLPEISPDNLAIVQKYYSDAPGLIIKAGQVCFQHIDLVLPTIALRRRQN